MDDFIDFCQHRRSVREFTSEAVDSQDLIDILLAASFAPSVGDLQPWQFIAVDSFDQRHAVAACCDGQEWLYDAPLIVVVLADMDRAEAYHGPGVRQACHDSCVAAIMNMLHAALARGLGGCWVSQFDAERLSETLSIPESCEVVALVALGRPARVDVAPKHVDPLDQLVFFDSYGNTQTDAATRLRDFGEAAHESLQELTRRSRERVERDAKPMAEKFKDQLREWMDRSDKKKE